MADITGNTEIYLIMTSIWQELDFVKYFGEDYDSFAANKSKSFSNSIAEKSGYLNAKYQKLVHDETVAEKKGTKEKCRRIYERKYTKIYERK